MSSRFCVQVEEVAASRLERKGRSIAGIGGSHFKLLRKHGYHSRKKGKIIFLQGFISINTIKMSAIGSLVFCTDCGNLLEPSKGVKDSILKCECCGTENKGLFPRFLPAPILIRADTTSKTITTKTKASSFPSLLRQKRSAIQTVERSDMKNEAVIQVTCPECGRKEVRYSAVQLRSADEGSTIFYSCDCGHKYVEVEISFYV